MRLTRSLIALTLGFCLAAPMAWGFGTSGSYLAARQASYGNDYEAAAEYYTRALALDIANPALMENAATAHLSLGRIDRALPIARRMEDGGLNSQVAALVLLADAVAQEDFDKVLADYAAGKSVGVLVDGLVEAWSKLGAGQAGGAFAKFDDVAAQQGLKSFGLYHKALALASVGDFEGADDILSGRAQGALQVSRRGVVAHAQILSELGRTDDALELIRDTFGATPAPTFAALLQQLQNGTLGYDIARTPREGVAEVFHSVAGALAAEAAPGYALLYSRVSEHLNPAHVDAILLSASLLEDVEQFDLAVRAYDRVPPDHPAFVAAELGRADALLEASREEAAIEVLTQLARTAPDLVIVHMTLGDVLRRLDRFAEATPAYDKAIALLGQPGPQQWALLFSRGITLERTNRWQEAEADFRKALELSPNQPQVLNYLGYSLVELQTNLDEALGMIERAVQGRPDDGYITDSLGWVLYRMGRYDEAVVHMERAAELVPVDPIINDHLGDVLWAVGRQMEARFQWRRALSFDPEPDEEIRIRRKLDVGLDVVLEEEGAPPLAVAEDR